MKTLRVFVVAVVALALGASAAFAGPGVSLTTYDDWLAATGTGTVRPYTTWDSGLENHYPGQQANFRASTVTALPGFTEPFIEERPGLLMAWGDDYEEGDLIGAWTYEYGKDPDLTNQIVSIWVHPPFGMDSISIGLIDSTGLIKSWDWNVGENGPLHPCEQVQVIINPMLGWQAGATSFSEDAGFDITSVTGLIFDERGDWLNMQSPSPLNDPHPWNYWKDFQVKPIPEPTSLLALTAGLLGLAGFARRKVRK